MVRYDDIWWYMGSVSYDMWDIHNLPNIIFLGNSWLEDYGNSCLFNNDRNTITYMCYGWHVSYIDMWYGQCVDINVRIYVTHTTIQDMANLTTISIWWMCIRIFRMKTTFRKVNRPQQLDLDLGETLEKSIARLRNWENLPKWFMVVITN